MYVTMLASTPCLLCGYRTTILMTGSARINKRSMCVTGPLLGGFRFSECPECGSPTGGASVPRSAYRLHPEDAEKVAACRMRRWGIEGTTGPLVEAVKVA